MRSAQLRADKRVAQMIPMEQFAPEQSITVWLARAGQKNNRMKKLILICAFLLASCGGSGDSGGTTPPTPPPPTADTDLTWDDDNWDEKNWQ